MPLSSRSGPGVCVLRMASGLALKPLRVWVTSTRTSKTPHNIPAISKEPTSITDFCAMWSGCHRNLPSVYDEHQKVKILIFRSNWNIAPPTSGTTNHSVV